MSFFCIWIILFVLLFSGSTVNIFVVSHSHVEFSTVPDSRHCPWLSVWFYRASCQYCCLFHCLSVHKKFMLYRAMSTSGILSYASLQNDKNMANNVWIWPINSLFCCKLFVHCKGYFNINQEKIVQINPCLLWHIPFCGVSKFFTWYSKTNKYFT